MGRRPIPRLVGALAITTSLFAVQGSVADPVREVARAQVARTRPDLVVLVTDDQRRDTLRYMPIVRRALVRRGIEFTNGYVVNPVCCPSRASILTGQYSHSTGVYTNRGPDGGFSGFDDDPSIATLLRSAGYRTGLFGKYLNGYRRTEYVPPGWDRWFATFRNGGYYDYSAVSDGTFQRYGSHRSDYGTTVLASEAVSFIHDTERSTPLFMYWAPHAPHEPAIPERTDRDSFGSLPRWRPPSYDEHDVSDKPAHVRYQPRIDAETRDEIDVFRRRQIQSLQSVDRSVGEIIQALREEGRLGNTMIVFLSDNGMLWGEHRLRGKSEVYEEAVGVPFVVRYDALVDEPRSDDHLALNIDLAPTFAAAAGVDAPDAEGRSLLPLLRRTDAQWRRAFLIEHMTVGVNSAPAFCAIHTARYVLVRYGTSEEELYDLARDPDQLTNRDGWERYRATRRTLRSQLRRLCDPRPPGFSF